MMQNRGFTLIEMVVSIALFTLLVGVTSSIFLLSIKNQRQSLSTQEVLDQTSYLMEYMSRSLRMAIKDDIESGGITKDCLLDKYKVNYEFDNMSKCLNFRNYKNECQQFCLEGTRIKDENGDYLTSENLQVSSFLVEFLGEYQYPDDQQPRVTISLNVLGKDQSSIKIQTTISQRNLDVRK